MREEMGAGNTLLPAWIDPPPCVIDCPISVLIPALVSHLALSTPTFLLDTAGMQPKTAALRGEFWMLVRKVQDDQSLETSNSFQSQGLFSECVSRPSHVWWSEFTTDYPSLRAAVIRLNV